MENAKPAAVIGKDGVIGTVDPAAATARGDGRIAHVRLQGGGEVLVPAEALLPGADGTFHLPVTRAELLEWRGASQRDELAVFPVVVEELHVDKRRVQTGGIRVTTHVREHEEVVDEPLLREEVSVERVPVNRIVDGPLPIRHEGEVTIVPLVEEELVLQRRYVLREEVRISKIQVEVREPQHVVLRSEEAVIEELDPETQPARQEERAA